jgi:hypothetical protein
MQTTWRKMSNHQLLYRGTYFPPRGWKCVRSKGRLQAAGTDRQQQQHSTTYPEDGVPRPPGETDADRDDFHARACSSKDWGDVDRQGGREAGRTN